MFLAIFLGNACFLKLLHNAIIVIHLIPIIPMIGAVIPDMIEAISKTESDKKELQLSINSFDNPTELTGIKAWSQLILQLLFMTPGTYPTLPEMGVGIENYQFEFVDNVLSPLSASIIEQQRTYLSDIPLVAVTVEPATVNNETILLIQLTFDLGRDGSGNSVIAVNATPTSRHFLDFDISW